MKKILAYIMAALMAFTMVLTGSGTALKAYAADKSFKESDKKPSWADKIRTNSGESASSETSPEEKEEVYDFDQAFTAYIESLKGDENYMVSPMSFRFALCLLILGAEGETQENLLKTAGFASLEDCMEWANRLLEYEKAFNEEMSDDSEEVEEGMFYLGNMVTGGFSIANSIWNNASFGWELNEEYVENAKELLHAEAYTADEDELAALINDWVDDKTKGLIPRIVDDSVKESAAVLVNALYFKTAWYDSFTCVDDITIFTTSEGEEVEKDYIRCRGDFRYYEDDETSLVVVLMYGSAQMVFVKGSTENLEEKINQAEYKDVIVTMPKFEVESSFDSGELVDFMKENGSGIVFTDDADFTGIMDEGLLVDDIIQKTRISLDENGVEAAAVTAVSMKASAAFGEPEEPIEFTLDSEFSYYIYANTTLQVLDMMMIEPEMMFAGKIVK